MTKDWIHKFHLGAPPLRPHLKAPSQVVNTTLEFNSLTPCSGYDMDALINVRNKYLKRCTLTCQLPGIRYMASLLPHFAHSTFFEHIP